MTTSNMEEISQDLLNRASLDLQNQIDELANQKDTSKFSKEEIDFAKHLQSHWNTAHTQAVFHDAITRLAQRGVVLLEEPELLHMTRIFNDLKTRADSIEKEEDVDWNELKDLNFQTIWNISHEKIERGYAVALEDYLAENYRDAENILRLLVILNSSYGNIWLLLGNTQSQLEHFKDALCSYAMAMILDIDEPAAYVESAYCYLQIHEQHLAEDALEQADKIFEKMAIPPDDPRYERWQYIKQITRATRR